MTRHPCEICGTATYEGQRWCGPGCKRVALMATAREACKVCGSHGVNAECATCVREQVARERDGLTKG